MENVVLCAGNAVVDVMFKKCGAIANHVETYISFVISVYDAGISAHKFTILVPNLAWVLGFSFGSTLVVQWVMMHIASLKVIFRGRTNLVPENLYK